jgi:large subunit ribosomal protein L17
MRHRIAGRQFSIDSDHRRALLRNLAAALFEHGEIRTTGPKAKAVQPFVERLITIAKKGDLRARRLLESRLNDRKIHVWVADSNTGEMKKDNPYFDLPAEEDIEFNRYGDVRKAPRLVQHILTKVAPRYADRDGGYTRIVRLGTNRLGDGADEVLLQLVGEEEGPEIGGAGSRRKAKANRRAEFSSSLRKGAKKKAGKAESGAGAATAVADADEGEAKGERMVI